MPKHGMLVRIILGTAAAAVLAALAVTSAGAASARRSGGSLVGAGSSLVAPAVQGVWGPAYQAAKGVGIQYSPVGSGAGIAQITARTVDFGASDAPMTSDQAHHCHGCIEIPWALAATGPVYNIPGVNGLQLHLTGPVLARIYLGQITSWSDPALKRLNPHLKLPGKKITVVHRSDGSGDTFAFTDYLSKVSRTWASRVGKATAVSWPTGEGGKGNAGVAAIVSSTPGAIGYVSTFYVYQNHLHMARILNSSGRYTFPSVKSIESAAQLVKRVPANTAISITDPPRSAKFRNAWPISTFTYVIVPIKSPKASQLRAFIGWALGARQQKAIRKLVFAPMPTLVARVAHSRLKKIHP
ncbi:MAG TPA: phosphate ABC transporter substrate-binding protein PstS [Gaiellaceae bacterium]|nr:phosphate ABC transporter substrate-binding protein PstS [Gaiellaceae bacterium]